MISLDTNVVLRFLLDDVPEQTARATELIESTPVYVTDVVVVEIIYVLEKIYELPRKDICELVVDFLGFSSVVHNPRFLLNAIGRYRRSPRLSMVDCYASEEAGSFGNELVAFDRKLAAQGGAHISVLGAK